MARYTHSGNTQQWNSAHQNFLVAMKVDEANPSAPVTILAQTQAETNGDFTLEWGTDVDASSEDWAGRICVLVLDNAESAQKMKSASNDWVNGVLDDAGSSVVSARYWRLLITANNGNPHHTTVAELAFSNISGVLLDTSATASAISSSEANASNIDDFAFDDNPGMKWTAGAPGGGNAVPHYIGYDFGSDVQVGLISVMGQWANGGQEQLTLSDAKVQYSDNQVDWQDVGAPITGQNGWAAAETRQFTVQTPPSS